MMNTMVMMKLISTHLIKSNIMKTNKHYAWVFLLLFFVGACVLYACKRDNVAKPESQSVSPDGNISTVVDPCATCQYENLYKTVSNDHEIVGTVAICQTTTALTVTFTVSGDRERAWFQQTGVGVYETEPTALNASPQYFYSKDTQHGGKIRSFTYTIPLSEIGENGVIAGDKIFMAAYAVVPGADGAGGQVWAGNLKPPTQNPNSRYFCYTIKECETPPCPTSDCFYTQGYWFAKPNGSQWPYPYTATLGGYTYTYQEARAIFFSSNAKTGKTDAKQAFLQGLAYQLNLLSGVPSSTCNGAAAASVTINNYFANKGKVTPTTINDKSKYPANTAIKSAAGLLSDCFNANHCGENN